MDNILYANVYGVPVLTYGMIGVTTFVLAYFTMTDTDTKSNTNIEGPAAEVPAQPNMSGGGSKHKKTKRCSKNSKQSVRKK